MNKKLTNKQKKVLKTIEDFIKKYQKSPTFQELRRELHREGLKLKSNNSLVQYLGVLEERGFVQRFEKARGIRLLKEVVDNLVGIPLLGNANCGEALNFAEDYIEDSISISKKYIKGDKKDYFFVKAIGDSMDKAKIESGDLVLVKKIKGEPKLGDRVVAVINGLGTIKKFHKIDEYTPVLMPESRNQDHQPIILHKDDQITICGRVEKVFPFSNFQNV
jgi:repressor LexA